MRCSILVPAYNEEHSITSCLNSLIALPDADKEIIVIDDASTDRTVQMVNQFREQGVTLVRRAKNGGRAAALNSGIHMASGDIIVTTDADTVVPSDWLQRYKLWFNQKDIVAVGGTCSARNRNSPLALAACILDQILNRTFKKAIVPNKLSGVNSAFLRDALLNIGGFDENAWWSEDSELCWRLHTVGKVVYDPTNVVNTLYPERWSEIWKRKVYWGYAMGLQFRKRMPIKIKLWLRPLMFMAIFISLMAFLITLPFGMKISFIPGCIFGILISSLTILYVPLGILPILQNRDVNVFKTVSLLAILPLLREFAYVFGMFMGFYRGKTDKIKPSWKSGTHHKH